MNVPTAVLLIQAISTLKIKCGDNDNPLKLQRSLAMDIVNELMKHLLSPMNVKMYITNQLESLSVIAHLVAYLFEEAKNDFIPAQQYHDLQSYVKSVFFCAARGKHEGNGDDFFKLYIILIGSDQQEELHGTLRTLSHNRSFNMLELGYQLNIASEIMMLYEKYPEWKKKDR